MPSRCLPPPHQHPPRPARPEPAGPAPRTWHTPAPRETPRHPHASPDPGSAPRTPNQPPPPPAPAAPRSARNPHHTPPASSAPPPAAADTRNGPASQEVAAAWQPANSRPRAGQARRPSPPGRTRTTSIAPESGQVSASSQTLFPSLGTGRGRATLAQKRGSQKQRHAPSAVRTSVLHVGVTVPAFLQYRRLGYTVNRSGSGSCISVVRQGRFAAGRSRLGGEPLPRVAGALPRGFLLARMSAYRIGSCPAASSITR